MHMPKNCIKFHASHSATFQDLGFYASMVATVKVMSYLVHNATIIIAGLNMILGNVPYQKHLHLCGICLFIGHEI